MEIYDLAVVRRCFVGALRIAPTLALNNVPLQPTFNTIFFAHDSLLIAQLMLHYLATSLLEGLFVQVGIQIRLLSIAGALASQITCFNLLNVLFGLDALWHLILSLENLLDAMVTVRGHLVQVLAVRAQRRDAT